MDKTQMEKMRETLGKEYSEKMPDESLELMHYSFKLLARLMIKQMKEGGYDEKDSED